MVLNCGCEICTKFQEHRIELRKKSAKKYDAKRDATPERRKYQAEKAAEYRARDTKKEQSTVNTATDKVVHTAAQPQGDLSTP